MGVRININIDLPTDDPTEAYRMLQKLLYEGAPITVGWETTDEWFDANGPLSQDVIDAACEAYAASEAEASCG